MSDSFNLIDIPNNIPSSIPLNSRIYKDDCMYCFDTAENNPSGLDVCLQCYQSFSRGEMNHTAEHFNETNHSYYLNIVKTLKPDSERNKYVDETGERQQKIAKLEVKDLKDEDIYNLASSVYDIQQNKSYSIDLLSPRFQALTNEILTSNSSSREDEIKTWENEIYPCEHSIDLQQFENDAINLNQCMKCDLKENLWICLHCGVIGCGREQFGTSLRGNSHALEHFELTEHPVAIKLGSLSADDENGCDAYCYKCNDEIKVPNLSEKLLKYGIDMKKTVKTEKSLIELNIDQNLNWEFKLEGNNGEKLEPIFGPELTGFQNLGNSCYLNSVIQALFSLDNYKRYFKSAKFSRVENPSKDLFSQLIKIYDGLTSGRYSKPNNLKGDAYQLGIKPSTFKTLIGENHPEFKTEKQQDSFELLLYLLDKIDNVFGLKLNRELKFLIGNKVICTNCLHGSLNYELSDNLSVSIKDEVIKIDEESNKKLYKEVRLIDSLKDHCSTEPIEGFKCDNCKAYSTIALKSTGFKSFPEVLIINAKRIKLENWVPVKVDVPIQIPETLDLSELKAPEFTDGEVEIEQKSKEENIFKPNEEALTTLLSMGFPENKCLKGLYNTGNNNAEDAMNWIFAHMDDDEPFNPEAPSTSTSNEPSEESIQNLMAMGFSHQLSKKSLVLNNNDINSAVEWLFNNPNDNGVIEQEVTPSVNLSKEKDDLYEELLQSTDASAKYNIKAVICHKGTSPHTGHYVVFIKKLVHGTLQWVLFNDEKVVLCDESNLEDIKNNGYIYIFEKIKN